jgi:hypothetical protein
MSGPQFALVRVHPLGIALLLVGVVINTVGVVRLVRRWLNPLPTVSATTRSGTS